MNSLSYVDSDQLRRTSRAPQNSTKLLQPNDSQLPAVKFPDAVLKKIFIHLAVILDQETQTFPKYEWTMCGNIRKFQGLPPGPRVLSIQRPTFHALALVCWNWHSMATMCLYRDIYISSYAALASLVKVLTNPENSHLPPIVRTFVMANDIFSQPYVGYTKESMENLKTIYRVCPNLRAAKYTCPFDLQGAHEVPSTSAAVTRGRDSALRSLLRDLFVVPLAKQHKTEWCNATRLEVHFPRSRNASGSRPLLGPIAELPSLQELIIHAEHPSDMDIAGVNYCQIVLPEMPQLRRLSVSGWRTNKEWLRIPSPGCPLLHYLELINCTINPDQLCSIIPDVQSLESVVITGMIKSRSGSEFTFDLVGICGCGIVKLTYLSVPLTLFIEGGSHRPPELPYYVQHLVLTDELGETDKMDFNGMQWAEGKLRAALLDAAEITPCPMKRVQIIVPRPYEWKDAREVAEAAGMDFQVLYYSHAIGKPENVQLGLPSAVSE